MMNSIREQIKSMLTVEPRTGGFRALFTVRADLSILPDHFTNAPILPGMCLVQAVLLAGQMAYELPDLRLNLLKNAKLMHPILPGEQMTIEADSAMNPTGQITIKAKITGGGKRRAEISLIASAAIIMEAIPA